jgi:hypothetical protein
MQEHKSHKQVPKVSRNIPESETVNEPRRYIVT